MGLIIFIFLSTLVSNGIGSMAEAGRSNVFRFDKDNAGGKPKSFVFEITGNGPNVRWEVIADTTAPSGPNVLAQLGHAESGHNFPVAVVERMLIGDGEIGVKLKLMAGQEDQAGGLVWRYHDRNNYYSVRANALEDTVAVCYVRNGKRELCANAEVKATPRVWHSLKVVFKKNDFAFYFDGTKVMTAKGYALAQPGKVGLWTKADSVTYFDDFEVRSDDQ